MCTWTLGLLAEERGFLNFCFLPCSQGSVHLLTVQHRLAARRTQVSITYMFIRNSLNNLLLLFFPFSFWLHSRELVKSHRSAPQYCSILIMTFCSTHHQVSTSVHARSTVQWIDRNCRPLRIHISKCSRDYKVHSATLVYSSSGTINVRMLI